MLTMRHNTAEHDKKEKEDTIQQRLQENEAACDEEFEALAKRYGVDNSKSRKRKLSNERGVDEVGKKRKPNKECNDNEMKTD